MWLPRTRRCIRIIGKTREDFIRRYSDKTDTPYAPAEVNEVLTIYGLSLRELRLPAAKMLEAPLYLSANEMLPAPLHMQLLDISGE
jgi:hypothetical protein